MPDKPEKTESAIDEMDNAQLKEYVKEMNNFNKAQEKANRLKKDYSDMTKAQLADAIGIQETQADSLAVIMKMASVNGDITGALKAQKQLDEEIEKLNEMTKQSLSTQTESAVELKQLQNDILDGKVEETEENAKKIKDLETIVDQEKELVNQGDEKLQILRAQSEAIKEQYKAYANLSDGAKKVAKTSEAGFTKLGQLTIGLTKHGDTAVGQFSNMAAGMIANRDGMAGMALSFKKVFNIANLSATMFTKVVESTALMIKELDRAGTAFAAATGAGGQYRSQLEDVVRAGNSVGIMHEQASKAFIGLREELSAFAGASEGTQNALITNAGQMERIGIATKDTADLMNTFSRTMNLSSGEAVELTKNIALMGSAIGISAKKMVKDFQASQKVLAVYGKSGVKHFTNLAAASKAAGVEMSSLLGLAGKFDTFEDAADSVGKLNALLGSNLSATVLLMQTEDQRVESVIQQIQISGESFAQMDRFKQKALANAVGITDMAEANKIFGMSMSQYRSHASTMAGTQLTQDKWKETIAATVPIQEKLMVIIMKFAPKVEKILGFIVAGLDSAISGLDAMGDTLPWIILLVSSLGLGFGFIQTIRFGANIKKGATEAVTQLMKLKKAQDAAAASSTLTSNALGTVSGSAGKAGAASQVAGAQVKTGGAAARSGGRGFASSAWAIAAVGVAALGIGTGIYVAAQGLTELVTAFGNMKSGADQAVSAIWALMVPFVALMVVMGIALYTGVLPGTAAVFLAIGAAALMMGLGIGLAGLGMSVMITELGKLSGTQAAMAVLAIYAITGAMVAMVLVLGGVITVMALAAVVSAVMGVALTGLAGPIWAVGGAIFLMGAALAVAAYGFSLIFREAAGFAQALANVADAAGKVSNITATVSFVRVIANDLEHLGEIVDANLQSTLDTLVALSTEQSVENINTNSAQTRHDQMVTISTTLHNELDISIKIGDTNFVDHVKKAIKNDIDWLSAEMQSVTNNIVIAGD